MVRCGKAGRTAVLEEYITNDFLGIKQGEQSFFEADVLSMISDENTARTTIGPDWIHFYCCDVGYPLCVPTGDAIVRRLLCGEAGERRRSREECARLLSCLAATSSGRSYLLTLGAEWLVETLFTGIRQETGDSKLRQHLLGCLQKCSLRKAVQDQAISTGGVEWTLTVLHDADTLSDYTVEYATALLLNLTLRTAGKDRCEPPKARCLEALIDLLEFDNSQVKQYVHGSLYAVLTRGVLKERAKSLGLGEMLMALADVYRSQSIMPLAAQVGAPILVCTQTSCLWHDRKHE